MDELSKTYNLIELGELRERILSKINEALTLLNEAREESRKINEYAVYYGYNNELDIVKIESRLDEHLWDYVIEVTGIRRFMTATKEKELRKHIFKNKIKYSYENAADITTRLQQSVKGVIGSSFKEVFKEFTNVFFKKSGSSRSERRNTVKIEKEFRMYIGSVDSIWYCHDKALQKVNDLEFICDLINGKSRREYPHRISDLVANAIKKNEWLNNDIANEHFSIRLYKNGNGKIKFLSDIYNKINQYGADGTEVSFNPEMN